MHKSIATIESPEFINLQPLDVNPLMSQCEIKVLYVGENRNRSFISKEVATDMAKTLRGAPIVGYYKEQKEDFADHGHQMIIDDEGIKFECLTVPYGFVSPDAKVWFQTFDDTDDFGNVTQREYLMTTGYLWTGQFEECKLALQGGRPHSMELDEESLAGRWETNSKTNMDFFIINDATFSKLCILGEDVEPCFEGASITEPTVSSTFTKMDDDFKKTLFTMMQELQCALKGGQQMEDNINIVEEQVEAVETQVEENAEIPAATEETTIDTIETAADTDVEETPAPVEDSFAASKKDDEEDDDKSNSNDGKEEPSNDEDDEKNGKSSDEKSDTQDDDDDDKKKKYELLESENQLLQENYSILESNYNDLMVKYNELVAFKAEIEDAKKDEMIKSFAFLSDEDKKDVIENKSKYTIDEIESKLSVISVRKKVNFGLDNNDKNDNNIETKTSVMTYSLPEVDESVPAWISAVINNQNRNN